jgi:ubiquinone/menaquinone biosynthesis C-methylase UbiE
MKRSELWDTWVNAEIYREYVERYPIYRALNRRLVDLAQVSSARRVLDLGCGTGATTTACLEQLPADGEVEGVDAAATMLEAARGYVNDPRARFLEGSAGSVDQVVRGGFDRAVCNAAFWLFPNAASVLKALWRVLRPGGLFVFNVPFELLTHERTDPEPFQISLAHAVSARTGRRPLAPRLLDVRALLDTARSNGFFFQLLDSFHYRGRQGELMELMKVPALATQLAPELGYDACLDIVRQAALRNDPQMQVDVPWAYFVVSRCRN